jgi:hypothetical protein
MGGRFPPGGHAEAADQPAFPVHPASFMLLHLSAKLAFYTTVPGKYG